MAKAFINDIYPFFENDLTYQNLKNSRTKEDAMTSHFLPWNGYPENKGVMLKQFCYPFLILTL